MSAPYQGFRGPDGQFVIGAANQRLWLRLCDVIGRPDLCDDPRFAENYDRIAHRAELAEILQEVFAMKPAGHWVDLLLGAGIPAGPINDYAAALGSDHAAARGAVQKITHPVEEEYDALGFAAKLSGTPARVRRPPPLLNQHAEEILAELGLEDEASRAAAFSA